MIRQEQCDKVCRILDDVLANRPTERDSLIVATRKAFEALEGAKWIPVSERLPEESGIYYVTEKVYAVMDEKRQGKYKLVTDSATYDTNKKQWLKAKFLEVVAWMERTPWEGE